MGEFTHAIDDKGRMTIPAKFRPELAPGAVITRGFEKCLLIYTSDAFKTLVARAKSLSPTDPDQRALLRVTFSGASEASLDKQGRVTIPPFLRTYAGLDNEGVIIGVGDYAEVWNKAEWENQLAVINDPAVNAQRFAELNLAASQSGS